MIRETAMGRGLTLIPPLLVVAMPFAAFTVLCLRHFYELGGFWGDSGQLAALMWHSDPMLHTPLVSGGESFFATHLALIFLPLSAVSWLLPLTKIQFFAAFQGLCHALMALAVYWLLVSGYQMRTLIRRCGAALLALTFAFNGLAIAAARNPHFELLIVATAMLFLTARQLGRPILALSFFILCVATREDAGFHLCGVLSVVSVIDRRRGARGPRIMGTVAYAIAGFLCGVAALVVQKYAFPVPHSSMSGVYIGDPPFAHVTGKEIFERLLYWIFYRAYIVLPAVVAAIWGIRTKNPWLPAAYIAFIPWALLHLLAASEFAGTLSNYYPFPFLIAAFWPLPGTLHGNEVAGGTLIRPRPVACFAAMLALSFVGLDRQHDPGKLDVPASFWRVPSLEQQHATDAAVRRLLGASSLGHVMVDAGVAALVPDAVRESDLVSGEVTEKPDTIIYFVRGFQHPLVRRMADEAGLDRRYRVPGTSIRVLSDRPLDGLSGLVDDLK